MKLAPGIHRIGDNSMVNAYLGEQAGEVTIIESAVLHVASLGALFVGDAFATYAVTTRVRGPQVAPFTADAAQAVESLARLDTISADHVLPGHGDPWTGGVQEAIRQIRQRRGGSS